MARRNEHANDKGVSESIGFLLIFTIVIVGIGLVTLYGYPLLLKQQVSADEKIMEKNMIVLQNDIKSLAYKTVPFKDTSLKIGGGSLTVYDSSSSTPSSTFSIRNNSALPSPYYVNSFTPGELRYESVDSQTDISLQNGAVVMRPRLSKGSSMLSEPRWFYDNQTNTMVVNLINITSPVLMSKEGIGTVKMSLVGEPEYNEYKESDSTLFYLDFTSDTTQDYSVAWDNYFTNALKMPTPNVVGSTRTYTLPTDPSRPVTLVIKKFNIEIQSI
jgi:hypothetical protein